MEVIVNLFVVSVASQVIACVLTATTVTQGKTGPYFAPINLHFICTIAIVKHTHC